MGSRGTAALGLMLFLFGCASGPTEETVPPREPSPHLPPSRVEQPTRPVVLPRITVLPARDLPRDGALIAAIEEAFLDAGYDVLDAGQLAEIKERDSQLFADDPETLTFLRGQGAELVITCGVREGVAEGTVLAVDSAALVAYRTGAAPHAAVTLAAALVSAVDDAAGS